MERTVVYLIRHSEQVRPNEDLYDTNLSQLQNEKNQLSENGRQLARKLSELAELQNIDGIYSSHYERAYATAQYIAEKNKLEIKIDKRLGERKLRKFTRIE